MSSLKLRVSTSKSAGAFAAVALLLLSLASRASADELTVNSKVQAAEQQRIDAIAKASKATVAIFDGGGSGGGSGVLITPDGLTLTNFHVTASSGAAMKCGLSDGKLYDAVIVSIDPVGDVALIQMLGRDDFPTAEVGDSDDVQPGDWVFAAGNPFLLADDFTPTITYGMVSGVHRYQYPAKTLLEYTDCIQTDAAINPGNSGGPLFNAAGQLIGINGRGSFEKRGRVNVGVGYAISINQIMRFLGHLKSGRILDHATLGATVSTDESGRVIVDDILESSDAYRRGLRYGDAILSFADRDVTSANALKNVLGVYPRGWRVPLTFLHDGKVVSTVVRLMGLHDHSQLIDMVQQEQARPKPRKPDAPDKPEDSKKPKLPEIPGLDRLLGKPKIPKIVEERYLARRGYANYWYNLQEQERLDAQLRKTADFADLGYSWQAAGKLADGKPFTLSTSQNRADLSLPWGKFKADFSGDLSDQLSPPRSGGLLLALHCFQRYLDKGLKQYGEVYYLGQLPAGPERTLSDCLIGLYQGMELRLYFDVSSGELRVVELWTSEDDDPCELVLSDYGELQGRRLPRQWKVLYGDNHFAEIHIKNWEKSDGAATEASTAVDTASEEE